MRIILASLAMCGLLGCEIHVPLPALEYNARCVEALNTGDLAQADALCDHALEFQDRYWDALNNKGLIAMQRGDDTAAKLFFIRAIRANPNMVQSYVNLCQIAAGAGEFTVARDRCLAALRINPDDAAARHDLGLVYLRLNRLDEAEKTFRHLVASAPSLAAGYADMGTVLVLKQKPQESLEWFDHALLLSPEFLRAWKGKANALAALGQHEHAREALKACLDLDQNELECRRALRQLE